MSSEWIVEDDVDHYTWLVVLGVIASFGLAFGIGANDVANAFATSVGSKALTIKQACAIAVVMEFIGATFLGVEVVKTIRKGIADPELFESNPPLLMWGCLSCLIAVSIWLIVATKFEMPVSTTHSVVGGMIGMAISAHGPGAVVWYKAPDPPDKPLPGGFFGVVLSWFISPILSGCFASVLFFVVRIVLRNGFSKLENPDERPEPFNNSVKVYPALVFSCITIVVLYMLMKGFKSDSMSALTDLDFGVKVGISFGVGAFFAIAFIPAYLYCKKRIETGAFAAPKTAFDVAREKSARKNSAAPDVSSTDDDAMPAGDVVVSMKDDGDRVTGTKATEAATEADPGPLPKSKYQRFMASLTSSLNQDIHAAVNEEDETVMKIHQNAEQFNKKAEAMFTYLQVFSACFDALAHGANDVANAVGPFATLYLISQSNEVTSKQDMGDNKYWICGMGGVGISVGLCLYGSQILRAIGVKLAVITPSRGFCIEMGSSTVVIVGSYLGLPLSTTHCQVGATVGVALLEGFSGFNLKVLGKTAFGWVFTCVFCGFLTALLFSFVAYAPTAYLDEFECVNVNATR